jgi:hypothetical protein
MPHSVSILTIVPSNDRVLPKSIVCCRSGGIGMCTQCASTDLIFIAVSATENADRCSFSRFCEAGYIGSPEYRPLGDRQCDGLWFSAAGSPG